MIKLLIGAKGSGKTKALIELVNTTAEASQGSVICIEKGDTLTHSVTYKARLIDTDDYAITTADTLYGFIAGIMASNSDITDIFVDSSLKICSYDAAALEAILDKLAELTKDIRLVMTYSMAPEDCSDKIKALI